MRVLTSTPTIPKRIITTIQEMTETETETEEATTATQETIKTGPGVNRTTMKIETKLEVKFQIEV